MSSILVIDDEPGIREILQEIFEDEGYSVFLAGDGEEGLLLLKTEVIDLVYLDVWLPKIGGLDLLGIINRDFESIPVIMISGHASVDMAVNAMKKGALDFVEKPLDMDTVLNLTEKHLFREEPKKISSRGGFIPEPMVGSSAGILQVRTLIEQSATSDARILVLGENGSGKELVARHIHAHSQRSDGPFIEVNCAAIPDNLIESELFGHEKGAFTGAVQQRQGKFEQADGGTLFLDEVADMSLSAQAKVLRVIQEMTFHRLGGQEQISVDVRLIAATNKDITREVEKGRFREDLFYRLNVIPITIPPLRERKEDILLLLKHFFNEFAERDQQEKVQLDAFAESLIQEYSWPGNIRELRNFAERVHVMCSERALCSEMVKEFLDQQPEKGGSSGVDSPYSEMKLNDAKNMFERTLLLEKLEENQFNITRTAEALGIYPSNLHNKIRKFGIEIKK